MEIFHGKCVICTESTLVLSGKDKQKFVELLKEHYFDLNHINDNKFLLQFKEKRSEKSICISCAYIIECYVTVRNKFSEQKSKVDKKCSICRKESNLTNGKQLISDANTLLKTNNKRTLSRLSLFCLDCCFTIISWQKMTETISNYTQKSNQINGEHKRRHSVEDVTNSEDEPEKPVLSNTTPARRSRRQSIGSVIVKKSPAKTVSPRTSKYKKAKLNKSNSEIDEKLTHLSTVSAELSSNEISLNDKFAHKIKLDDRMMFDIAYISCEANSFDNYQKKSKRQSYSSDNNEQSQKNSVPSKKNNKMKRKMSICNSNGNEVFDNDKKKKTRAATSSEDENSNDSSIILISDSDTKSPKSSKLTVRKSLRKIKSKRITNITQSKTKVQATKTTMSRRGRARKLPRNITVENKNQCASCPKQYKKKYRLQLHELEHEASFRPHVVVQKKNKKNEIDNKSDSESETADKTEDNMNVESQDDKEPAVSDDLNSNEESKSQETNSETGEKDEHETQDKVETLVKQVVNDTLSQLENEISENIVKQVVDDTLSQIEDNLPENTKESQKNNDQESVNKETEITSENQNSKSNDEDQNIEESEIKKTNDEGTNENDEINKIMPEEDVEKLTEEQNDENDTENEAQTNDTKSHETENVDKQTQENSNENDDCELIESITKCKKNNSGEENGPIEIINSDVEDDSNTNGKKSSKSLDKNKDNEKQNSQDTNEMIDTSKSLFLSEVSEMEINNDETSNIDPLSDQFDSLADDKVCDELSTDNIAKIEDEESDMESLKISNSSSSNSPVKKNDTDLAADSDKYEIVENLLQNLGA